MSVFDFRVVLQQRNGVSEDRNKIDNVLGILPGTGEAEKVLDEVVEAVAFTMSMSRPLVLAGKIGVERKFPLIRAWMSGIADLVRDSRCHPPDGCHPVFQSHFFLQTRFQSGPE
jgi:hypothetical protein